MRMNESGGIKSFEVMYIPHCFYCSNIQTLWDLLYITHGNFVYIIAILVVYTTEMIGRIVAECKGFKRVKKSLTIHVSNDWYP